MKKSFNSIKWIFVMIAGIIAISVGILSARESDKNKESRADVIVPVKKVDKNAEKILKSMTDYLLGLKDFTFTATGYYEYVIDSTGQKIQVNNNGKLFFKRPDKFKAERKNQLSDAEFFYNGKEFTVYGKKQKYYAQEPLASDLDKALDYSRDILNVETPAADLLYTDAYSGLMQDVTTGTYIGKAMAGGKPCHHLAFTGSETDFQIWIEDGPDPLPRKYLITSKKINGAPEYCIEIPEWKTNAKLSEDLFTFHPSKGDQKIEFLKTNTEPVSSNKK